MLPAFFYLGAVGAFVTATLVAPILLALRDGEADLAGRMAIYLLLGGFLFGGAMLAILGRQRHTPRIGRLFIIALVWLVLPLVCAVPLWDVTELTLVEAVFESYSGFTTAGSSVLNSVEIWPRAMVFYRAQLQWLGGLLALLTVVLIAAPLGIGGLSKRRGTFGSGGDVMVGQGSPLALSLKVARLYTLLTGACLVALFLTGHRLYIAAGFSMSALSTGGFLLTDDAPDTVLTRVGLIVVAVFLILGATSVFWQRRLIDGRFRDARGHRESYSVIVFALILSAIVAVSLAMVPGSSTAILQSAAEGAFNAASLVATSGIESRPGVFTLLPYTLVLFVVLVGGSAYSTSGGIKHYRLGAMFAQSWSELDRLVFPNAVQKSHFGSNGLESETMKSIWSFFVAAIFMLALACLGLTATGLPFEAALIAAVSNFATAGPVYGAGWDVTMDEIWPRYSEMGTAAQLMLVAIMLAGRVELLSIVALFSRRYWRSR